MKTTILNQQKKWTTNKLALSVLALVWSSFTFAKNIDQDASGEMVSAATVLTNVEGIKDLKKQQINLEEEINFLDSIARFSAQIHKDRVGLILENELIIESQEEIDPSLYLDKTSEEVITEDHQIIESNLDNTTYPLDFNLIDRPDLHNRTADIKNRAFQKKNIKS